MKVSLNTIKQYTEVDLSVDELIARINAQLGGVEEVTNLGERYEGAVIVRVVECIDHPNADRLHVCKVDDGGVVEDVQRDEKGLVQVVCGAPNVRADMYAVWLPPKSTVPSSFDEKELFVLDARELRGVVSNGMLASQKELALGDAHDGILEIDPSEWKPNDVEIKPGASFARAYGLDDVIINIENKMFTHRPDLFGQLGVAREIAGIQHRSFTSPDWYKVFPSFNRGEGLELRVENNALENVPRFMAVAIRGVTVGPSPLWLQVELARLGSKSISNIVDVTNYIMLLTAQPTHAYDYDKLRGKTLEARMARPGERVKLLNDKTYELDENDIVIADGEGPVGLAGIMGGGDSEVSSETKNIVLEVASFDMYTVRRSSMRHGLFTEALTRFNKGQSPRQNDYVMSVLMQSIKDVAGGEQASDVLDITSGEVAPADNRSLRVDPMFINDRLGSELSSDEMKSLLTNVEIDVEDELTITPPFWRTDLELPEDIVEEVGRLYGFDRLPRELPRRSTSPAVRNQLLVLKRTIRESLSGGGANEILSYSFVHENILKRAGQNPEHAYHLSNALSPDLQYYRLSLTPSLLDKVHQNIRAGYSSFAFYELGKTHFKGHMDDKEPAVPSEDHHVAFVVVYGDKQRPEGAAYYHAKKYLDQLTCSEGLQLQSLADIDVSSDELGKQLTAPYEPNRSAVFVRDGRICGVVGEFTAGARKAFKLPAFVAGFELRLDMLATKQISYQPLPRFPKVSQDISLRVLASTKYSDVFTLADETVRAADVASGYGRVGLRTIYQQDGSDTKTITLHVEVASETGTLTDTQVGAVLDALAERAAHELSAERV